MQNRVLDAANVLVYRRPIHSLFFVKRNFLFLRRAVTQIVPGAVNKSVHGVGFSARRLFAFWALDIHKFFYRCKRVASISEIRLLWVWKLNWQIFFRNWNCAAIITVNYRYWCAPKALP